MPASPATTKDKQPKQKVHFHEHGKGLRATGVVHEIRMHPNRKHASMTVRHGEPSKEDGSYVYEPGENSTHVPVMAADHAKKFRVGQKVVVHIGPDEGETKAPAARPGSHLAQNRAAVKAAMKHRK